METGELVALFGLADLPERLAAVEERIRSVLVAGGSDLGSPSWRVAGAGGKRLRPVVTIVCAQLGGVFDQRVVDGAAAVELVQVGSLIHDDLFDSALTRRGAATINATEGSGHALLAGNWVLAAASRLAIDVAPLEGYLAAFRHGMPPHGGFAIGLERWVARVTGVDNIREVTLFPRDLTRLAP